MYAPKSLEAYWSQQQLFSSLNMDYVNIYMALCMNTLLVRAHVPVTLLCIWCMYMYKHWSRYMVYKWTCLCIHVLYKNLCIKFSGSNISIHDWPWGNYRRCRHHTGKPKYTSLRMNSLTGYRSFWLRWSTCFIKNKFIISCQIIKLII